MVRIAVCDDNPLQLDIMKEALDDYIKSVHFPIDVQAFSSGKDLLQSVRTTGTFDIYILDVIMPGINGFEVATTLRMMKDSGKIIFLTSTHEYAVASYDVDAFYYILKPIDCNKLFSILNKALCNDVNNVVSIFVKTRNGEVNVNIDEITYVDISDRTLNYHLNDGTTVKSLTLRTSFKEAVNELTSSDRKFAFSSVSTLVNLAYVDVVDSSTILLFNGTLLYPSRNSYSDFKNAWKNAKNGNA